METKVGTVAFITREYIVAEVLEVRPEGPAPVGYSIFGPAFGEWRVFPDKEAALVAAKSVVAAATASHPA